MNRILRIKELLLERGLTIGELADRLGIHRTTLSNMIHGNPTIESLISIANALQVSINDLFYFVHKNTWEVTKNEYTNIFVYDDEHIYFQGNLPHFTGSDFGTFMLTLKNYNFSIVPDPSEIYKFVFSDINLEKYLFRGNVEGKINIQLFSTFTTLNTEEYTSFISAVTAFITSYRDCYNEILIKLGATDFSRISESNYFRLGTVSIDDWMRLMKLSQKYDLDVKDDTFEIFNSTGQAIIIYNRESVDSSGIIKTWIIPIEEESNNNEIVLAWYAPSQMERRGILSKQRLTAHESYVLLQEKLLPKARKLFKKI